MTAASRPPVPDPTDPDGFSRRAFLTRSAAGGAGRAARRRRDRLFGTASAIPGPPKGGAGYGPLVRPAAAPPPSRWTPTATGSAST